jgi:hypothetical protein
MTIRPIVLALLMASGAVLAGCGKTGELERPAPLWGEAAKHDYDTQRAAEAGAKAARDSAARRNEQNNTVFDPAAGPAPVAPYAPPLQGRTDPLGPGPQTAGQQQNNAPDQ